MSAGITIEHTLLVSALLLLLSVLASKTSSRLGVPALVLFIVVGMLAGSEGPGGIPYDNPRSAQDLGIIALAYILFAGGLETDRKTLSQVLWQGVSLATIGVIVTAVLFAWFATPAAFLVAGRPAAGLHRLLHRRGGGILHPAGPGHRVERRVASRTGAGERQ